MAPAMRSGVTAKLALDRNSIDKNKKTREGVKKIDVEQIGFEKIHLKEIDLDCKADRESRMVAPQN
jgi:hypothetical protein